MGLKAAAYTALSAACFPIAGMLAAPDLRAMLAVLGFAFSMAALLAIVIYRKALTEEQSTPAVTSRLTAGMVAVGCLGIGQLLIIVPATVRAFG